MRLEVEWQETVYDFDIYDDLGPDYPGSKLEGPNVKPPFVIEAPSLEEGVEIAYREAYSIIRGPDGSKLKEDCLQRKLRLLKIITLTDLDTGERHRPPKKEYVRYDRGEIHL